MAKSFFSQTLKKLISSLKNTNFLYLILLLGLIFVIGVDWFIGNRYSDLIYTDIDKIPKRKMALVLGTSKYYQDHYNAYYVYRLNAATDLYQKGKVDGILVSGDNSEKSYNETEDMTKDLIAKGIPSEYITQDYAGFRTLDSVVRANKIFDLDKYTIVSQKFHCQRAMYIAKQKGQNPIAFVAKDVEVVFGLKVRLREVLARFRAFLDCQILRTQPKFLGKKEQIQFRL